MFSIHSPNNYETFILPQKISRQQKCKNEKYITLIMKHNILTNNILPERIFLNPSTVCINNPKYGT
jgi:hypothetical protein